MSEFRVKFVTRDGLLLKNRLAMIDFYYRGDRPETEFIKNVLEQEGRELGVHVLSYTITKQELTAVVDWIKKHV